MLFGSEDVTAAYVSVLNVKFVVYEVCGWCTVPHAAILRKQVSREVHLRVTLSDDGLGTQAPRLSEFEQTRNRKE